MFDEYPEIQIGDTVRSIAILTDDGAEVAKPGDIGRCVWKAQGCFPTILWERTRRAYDCDPGFEVTVIGGELFSCDPMAVAARKKKTTDAIANRQ